MRNFDLVQGMKPVRCLRWFVPRTESGFSWRECHCLPLELFDDAFELSVQQTIDELDLRLRLSRLFLPTAPVWYGFWARSPLSKAQAGCLSLLLRNVQFSAEHEADEYGFERLIRDLIGSEMNQIELAVEIDRPLSPTFSDRVTLPHCPRCRAVAETIDHQQDLRRWPRFVECAVCNLRYDPRITWSPIDDEWPHTIDQIICEKCGASGFIEDFDESQHEKLDHLLQFDRARQAYDAAQGWQDFFLDYPDWQTRWLPEVTAGFSIDAPERFADVSRGVPFVRLADDYEFPSPEMSEADARFLEGVRQRSMTHADVLYDAITEFERTRELATHSAMICPECDGDLRGAVDLPAYSRLKTT